MGVGVCASGLARAQTPAKYAPNPRRIASWLKSGSAQDRAWGAYYVVQTGNAAFLPKLEAMAERCKPLPYNSKEVSSREKDDCAAMTEVLAGIIQLKGKLSAEVLVRLAEDFPVQSAILLAQMPQAEAEPALLTIYHMPLHRGGEAYQLGEGEAQMLAAELLALRPPAGFAASLLRNMDVLGVVDVTNLNGLYSSLPSGALHGCYGPGSRKDWPVMTEYSLVFDEPAVTIIANYLSIKVGKDTIYAQPQQGYHNFCSPRLDSQGRMMIVARMLGVEQDTLPFDEESYGVQRTIFPASSTAEFTTKVTQFVDEEKKKFLELETQLQQKGLITAEEIKRGDARSRLLLSLHDDREAKNLELPMIAFPSEQRVEWTTPYIWYVGIQTEP
jgi:hypothetical protein